jgi:hypothetical protein
MIRLNCTARGAYQREVFLITPALCEVGPHAQIDVEMVAHHGIAANVDTEDSRELLEPQSNPLLAVIVVLSGN